MPIHLKASFRLTTVISVHLSAAMPEITVRDSSVSLSEYIGQRGKETTETGSHLLRVTPKPAPGRRHHITRKNQPDYILLYW